MYGLWGDQGGRGNQLILRVKCVIHFFVRFVVVVFFLQKLEKLEENTKIKTLQNFNGENVVASLKKGGVVICGFLKKT